MKIWSQISHIKYAVCVCLLLCMTCAFAIDPLSFEYQKNVDHEVITVIGVAPDTGSLLLVTKEFLSKRKAKVDPIRSKSETYKIIDIQSNTRTLLLEVDSSEKLVVGRAATVPEGYMIPVIRNHSMVELYTYNSDEKSVKKTDESNMSGYLSAAYAVSDGYIVIVSKRAQTNAFYISYYEKEPLLLTAGISVLTVDDVIDVSGSIYLVGNGVVDNAGEQVWQVSLTRREGGASTRRLSTVINESGPSRSKYIPTLQNVPSLLITRKSLDLLSGGVELMIKSLRDIQSTIWDKKLPDIQADSNYSVAEICPNNYLIAEKKSKKNPPRQYIDFTNAERKAKHNNYPQIEQEKTVFTGIFMYPYENNVYVVTNFSKFEDVRRDDGWYSWYGYRVDSVNVGKTCGN